MIFVEGRRLFTIAFTVRMRSEVLDVSLLAKRLGGGGHREAAGATIDAGFREAKQVLQDEISRYLC